MLEGKIVVDLDIKWEWTKPQNLDDDEPVRRLSIMNRLKVSDLNYHSNWIIYCIDFGMEEVSALAISQDMVF